MFETIAFLTPFLALGFLGSIGSALGSAVSGIGNAVSNIPVVGDVLSSPIAQAGIGLIPGVGPIGAAAMGALGGLQGGGGAEGALGGAATGFGAQQLMETFQQQRADAERARELTEQAMGFGQQASDIALQQHSLDEPLRQAFRHGAMNFADPTNPFAQMGPAPQMPMPGAEANVQAVPETHNPMPAPGSIQQRVSDLLMQGSLGRGGGMAGNVRDAIATPDFNPSVGGGGGGGVAGVGKMHSPLLEVAHAL